MLPPPTTIATETPARLTSAICSAMMRVVLTSTPVPSPANASPDIFSRTRENRGRAGVRSLTKRVPRKAPHANSLAERADRAIHHVADAHGVVLDEGLIEQTVLLEPLIQLPLDDLFGDLGRLSRGYAGAELRAQTIDDVARNGLAVQISRRHRGDVHGQVARKLSKLRVVRHEVRFAVELDQHADLAAGVDVAADQSLVGGALGFLRRLGGAAFEEERLGALDVAAGVEQRLPAIHHRRAGLFAQRLDLFGSRLVGNQRPASAMVVGASSS